MRLTVFFLESLVTAFAAGVLWTFIFRDAFMGERGSAIMCTVFALIAGSTALILSHAIAWLAVPPVVAAMGVAPLYASYHDDRPYRKNPVRYVGVLVLGSAAVAIGIAHLPF